jgi:hypothetical protein
MTKKTPVTIHLDSELKSWLDRASKKRRCSISQVIRDFVVDATDDDGEPLRGSLYKLPYDLAEHSEFYWSAGMAAISEDNKSVIVIDGKGNGVVEEQRGEVAIVRAVAPDLRMHSTAGLLMKQLWRVWPEAILEHMTSEKGSSFQVWRRLNDLEPQRIAPWPGEAVACALFVAWEEVA